MSNTSFVNRLDDKQIENFLDKLYPRSEGFNVSFSLKQKHTSSEKYWAAKIFHFGWETPHYVQLEEYNSTLPNSSEWIAFLNNIFGKEYKDAFLKNCISSFEQD